MTSTQQHYSLYHMGHIRSMRSERKIRQIGHHNPFNTEYVKT